MIKTKAKYIEIQAILFGSQKEQIFHYLWGVENSIREKHIKVHLKDKPGFQRANKG